MDDAPIPKPKFLFAALVQKDAVMQRLLPGYPIAVFLASNLGLSASPRACSHQTHRRNARLQSCRIGEEVRLRNLQNDAKKSVAYSDKASPYQPRAAGNVREPFSSVIVNSGSRVFPQDLEPALKPADFMVCALNLKGPVGQARVRFDGSTEAWLQAHWIQDRPAA